MTTARDRRSFFYESFASRWDGAMNQDELGKRLRLVFSRLLHPREVRGRLVLDAGAGTGHFSRVLSQWGARLVSLDVGPGLLKETLKKCDARAVAGNLLALPFQDGAFELALATEVIEHTTDPRRAVAELSRVLAPGGTLALTVPNRLWRPAIVLATRLGLRPYQGHENWVGYGELARWARESGLKVEVLAGFNLLPHTVFCRPAFDALDRLRPLHPWMINIALRARKP